MLTYQNHTYRIKGKKQHITQSVIHDTKRHTGDNLPNRKENIMNKALETLTRRLDNYQKKITKHLNAIDRIKDAPILLSHSKHLEELAKLSHKYEELDTILTFLKKHPAIPDQKRTPVKSFVVGRTYSTPSMIFRFRVTKRTAKSVWLKELDSNDPLKKKKITIRKGVESCKPYGSYSNAPIITADKVG